MKRWFILLLCGVLLGVQGCGRGPSGFTLLFVPKLKGIPYFEACRKGAEEAAKELGINLVYDGPTKADADLQRDLLTNAVASGRYNGILVACNNPDSLKGVLQNAQDQGQIVVTFDADASGGRDYFVNMATYDAVAEMMVDVMAEELEPKATGKVAILTSWKTAPNQSEWAKRIKAYAAKKYPRMEILPQEEHGEDREKGIEKAKTIINANPDLKGIIGLTSVAVPAAAEAVRQFVKKGHLKPGQIKVTGVSTPKDMRQYVKDGTVKSFVLWNPVDLGYLTVYVAWLKHKGKMPENGTGTIEAGRLGKIQVRNNEVLLAPMKFDRKNIDKYDF